MHLKGWLAAVNSNEGGRVSRDLRNCLGRRVGACGGRVLTCKNVIWPMVRGCVNGVTYVGLVVNNSSFTYGM